MTTGLVIRYGSAGMVPSSSTLVATVDGRLVGSAARLPDDSGRWLVVPADTPERAVHRHERGYVLVDGGEPGARAALEKLAVTP